LKQNDIHFNAFVCMVDVYVHVTSGLLLLLFFPVSCIAVGVERLSMSLSG